MSDIEQRLREGIGRSGISGGICADDCDAANRLMDEAADTIEAIEAREARLSEALRALLDCPDIADNDHKDEETHAAERVARAALSGSGSGWREPEPIKEVKALRQALLECRERAETGGRRIETAMDACEDISEIATCALPPEGWQGPAAPQQGGE